MTHAYVVGQGDVVKGVVLGAWVLACDVALKALARAGGCGTEGIIDAAALSSVYDVPASCPGTAMAGPSIQLMAHAREGALLGLGGGMTGFTGQVYGLALLFVATVLTILIVRWRWQSNGDTLALGALWAGAFVEAMPRLLGNGNGSGVAELVMFGFSTGVGDIALLWGSLWLAWRFVGEFRA